MAPELRPVTGTHLFQRERCARWVWLDFHGDASRRIAPDAATAAAMARGRAHESEIVSKLDVVEPKYALRDFEAGARATRALMESGTPLIYQGVLTADGKVGKPDLLRREGDSYVVGDVKASAHAKVEHAMQVAFYSDLLGSAPARAFLILGDGREEEIRLADAEPLYREALEQVEAIRERRREPRPVHGRWCAGCQWRAVCLPEMEARGDLSLVVGVTSARREALEEAGVGSVAALAACDPAAISERTELPFETLRRLRLQASALQERSPKRLSPSPWRAARIGVVASIARHPHASHFAELVAYRTLKEGDELRETWIHASAPDAASEGDAYRRFLRSLAQDRDAPIYHFGAEFPDALAELDARHGRRGDPIGEVLARLADVQAGVRSSVVLPVLRYDLASVARALGVVRARSAEENDDALTALRRRLADDLLTVRRIRIAAARESTVSALATTP